MIFIGKVFIKKVAKKIKKIIRKNCNQFVTKLLQLKTNCSILQSSHAASDKFQTQSGVFPLSLVCKVCVEFSLPILVLVQLNVYLY